MSPLHYLLVSLLGTTAVHAADMRIQTAVAEVITNTGGNLNPANGLLFSWGNELFFVTAGHEFEFASGSCEIITSHGDRLAGILENNNYSRDDALRADVALVRIARGAVVEASYVWQHGLLIERQVKAGTRLSIYNSRELISGYDVIEIERGSQSITLRAPADRRALEGMSGGVVAAGDLIVGIVRDVDPRNGTIGILRIDAVTRFLAQLPKSRGFLPCGDAELLASWAQEEIHRGAFPRARTMLDDARSLLAGFSDADAEGSVSLVNSEYNVAVGNYYDAREALLQSSTFYEHRDNNKKQAIAEMLLGRLATLTGFRFSESAIQRLPARAASMRAATKNYDEAEGHFRRAAELLRGEHDDVLLAQALMGQAAAASDERYYQESLRLLKEALSLCRGRSDKDALRAAQLISIQRRRTGFPAPDEDTLVASLRSSLTQRELADSYLEDAVTVERGVKIYNEVGSPFEIAMAYMRAGANSEDVDSAFTFYQLAFDLCKAVKGNKAMDGLREQVIWRSLELYPKILAGYEPEPVPEGTVQSARHRKPYP